MPPIGSGIVARAEADAEGGGFRMRSPSKSTARAVVDNKSSKPSKSDGAVAGVRDGGYGGILSVGGDGGVLPSPFEIAAGEGRKKKSKKRKEKGATEDTDGVEEVVRSPLETAGPRAFVDYEKEIGAAALAESGRKQQVHMMCAERELLRLPEAEVTPLDNHVLRYVST